MSCPLPPSLGMEAKQNLRFLAREPTIHSPGGSRGQRGHGKILESHASLPTMPQQQLASWSHMLPISSRRSLAPGHKTSDQVQGSPQPQTRDTLYGHPILE